MLRNKILYALLIAGLTAFYILYIDSIALIMLLCALIVPVILRVGLTWLHFTSACELHGRTGGCRVGESVPVTLFLESRCPLFFPQAVAELRVRHAFGKKPETLHLKFPVQPKNITRLTFYLHADYCGIVEARLVRLHVYDLFRLCHTSIRCTSESISLLVLPEAVFLPLHNAAAPVDHPDSERFAGKPGDDPSEIFAIREYQPGDQVSRMHWKLSSRSEEMLVKDFSAPIRKNILLYLECLPGTPIQVLEKMLGLLYSMAYQLIEGGHLCEIAWFDSNASQVQRITPDSVEALGAAFGQLYTALPGLRTDPACVRPAFSGGAYSSVTIITCDPASGLPALLEEILRANQRNLLLVSEQPPVSLPEQTELVQIDGDAPGQLIL